MKKQKETRIDDKTLLYEAMERVKTGDYSAVDESTFSDRELAQKFNSLINYFCGCNNVLVMKLNKSMTRIGDSSVVKDMIENVNSQSLEITNLDSASQLLSDSIEKIAATTNTIKDSSHSIKEMTESVVDSIQDDISIVDQSSDKINEIKDRVENFRDKVEEIYKIVDIVKRIASKSGRLALNASIEAARAGDAGRSFGVVAGQIRELASNTTASAEDIAKYVGELKTGINSISEAIGSTAGRLNDGTEELLKSASKLDEMVEMLNEIDHNIDAVNEEISTQLASTETFAASVSSLTDNFETLNKDCIRTGDQLYHISREIDKIRGDMGRYSAKLTKLDWMDIYEVDHLIFTWRLYNNIIGYEKLSLSQVNNASGCKIGKWLNSQTDRNLTSSKGYKDVYSAHDNLHKKAVEVFEATAADDRELALRKFAELTNRYAIFVNAMKELKQTVSTLISHDRTLI